MSETAVNNETHESFTRKRESSPMLRDKSRLNYLTVNSHSPNMKSENKVVNTKYTILTFLVLVFWQQIREVSSMMFFVIMVLQFFKEFSIGSVSGSVVPFLVVFFMCLFTEGIDDYRRYKRDKVVNETRYKKYSVNKNKKIGIIEDKKAEETIATDGIYKSVKLGKRSGVFVSSMLALDRPKKYIDVMAKDIKEGDIIMVKKGQKFPADCILINCNDENGELFIRTDQLDGETDWKRRQCCIELPNADDKIIATVEKPHKNIYEFKGTLKQDVDGKTIQIPVDLDNTAWADTVAATSDTLGLVIHTGFNTRAKMNTYLPRSKTGLIDKEIDKFISVLVFICVLTALVFTLLRTTSMDWAAFVILIRFTIIFSFMIPISLKVTLNMGRMAYANLVEKGTVVRNTAIQEDLGRISFFLTDKTGTLTQNEMTLKKLHIGTNCYDESEFGEIKNIMRKFVLKRDKMPREARAIGQKLFDLIETLALCHNVTPVETEKGIALQASSPDEIALVEFIRKLGFELVYRDRSILRITYTTQGKHPNDDPNITEYIYKIHHTFPFNSDTKRMGIILEREDDSYVFFEKGADTAMKKIVKENDWAEEETDDMARDGLRTLFIGKKELEKQMFTKFNKEYNEAKLTLNNRLGNMLEVQKKLEKGLDLLGVTGVEDKLQDDVKITLESLRNAGIKVWMLTGDKIETAISIAKSSGLLGKTDNFMVISDCTTEAEIRDKINLLKSKRYNSMVIDGISLGVVLDNKNASVQRTDLKSSKNYLLELFIEQTKGLAAVIGCRYTPTQKAMMAASLKELAGETVMCIGDGGNDVSMITEADAGVGIEGKEGNQAALSADFSLKKFCQVTSLLFIHGRGCYVKSAKLTKITLQRAFIITVLQAVFSALINCVPLSIFQGNMAPAFVLFTCFPVLTLYKGSDIKDRVALSYPELYKEMRMNNLCSFKELIVAVLLAYLQAVVISLFYWMLMSEKELQFYSVCVFTSAVFNEYVTILLFNSIPRKSTVVVILASIAALVISAQFLPELHISFSKLMSFAFHTLIVNCSAAAIQIGFKVYYRYLKPTAQTKISKYGQVDEDE